jgi:hypothetical protein
VPVDFWSPSYRASSSDLTVSISPLGLVELADEEFEVHGPRLNRYAAAWAWYLGHHHAQRREMGEAQLTINYVRTFADYINSFTFGKSVQFRSPEATSSIVPHLLKKVWEQDNDKEHVLWEMGQLASVTGDCFVKVAYEDGWVDALGVPHPGRTRIIPMNPAHCFPEYHPHDRSRLLRFKLKYRFWGTSPEGTRQVYTFTEILTDDMVEQYVNDELIDQYENPVGLIPVVHIPNTSISSSPWGQSDIWDIIPLNRELNEKMTEVSDIINYHSAPVTIITGAKASQLEKGARKVWAGLPKDANVFNLESRGEMGGAMEYVSILKRTMHELTGVPETALGESQPISNTSGVALAIQYQPMMNRFTRKQVHFTRGFRAINDLVIRTQAVHEPDSLQWNAWEATEPNRDQLPMLDPLDPITYETSVHWPEPLPVDALIKMSEQQQLIAMGLQSNRGALRELGEQFPNEKMAEVFEEKMEDIYDQGALEMVSSQVAAVIFQATGMVPGEGTAPVGPQTQTGQAGTGESDDLLPTLPPVAPEVVNEIGQRAFGARLPQRRVPESD